MSDYISIRDGWKEIEKDIGRYLNMEHIKSNARATTFLESARRRCQVVRETDITDESKFDKFKKNIRRELDELKTNLQKLDVRLATNAEKDHVEDIVESARDFYNFIYVVSSTIISANKGLVHGKDGNKTEEIDGETKSWWLTVWQIIATLVAAGIVFAINLSLTKEQRDKYNSDMYFFILQAVLAAIILLIVNLVARSKNKKRAKQHPHMAAALGLKYADQSSISSGLLDEKVVQTKITEDMRKEYPPINISINQEQTQTIDVAPGSSGNTVGGHQIDSNKDNNSHNITTGDISGGSSVNGNVTNYHGTNADTDMTDINNETKWELFKDGTTKCQNQNCNKKYARVDGFCMCKAPIKSRITGCQHCHKKYAKVEGFCQCEEPKLL